MAYFEKMALGYFDIVSFIFIFNLSAAIILWFIPGTRRDIKPVFIKYKKEFLITRICIVSGVFLLLWSLKSGNLSIVNTNAETSFLLSTAFIGIIFLGEKKNIPKKTRRLLPLCPRHHPSEFLLRFFRYFYLEARKRLNYAGD